MPRRATSNRRLLRVTPSIGRPTLGAALLAIASGGGQLVGYLVVPGGHAFHAELAVAIFSLTTLGISPMTGLKFQAIVHFVPWLSLLLRFVLTAALLVAVRSAYYWDGALSLVVAISIFNALGFSGERRAQESRVDE